MEQGYIQKLYTVEEIGKAFSMGMETAVFVMENSIGMSTENQRALVESMKKIINQNKILVLQKNIENNIYQ